MSLLSGKLLDPARILLALQQANEIAQTFSGCLEPEAIALHITNGIVERFHCAFVRIWLVEPDQSHLRLVASAGMYTRTDGFFGRVPMGAYKVGKIAQNRISFLSNNLSAEPWVGNREWAVSNQIRGFAGYPLMVENRVIGVLAMFSRDVLEPELLEVLPTLCAIASVGLENAIQFQKEKQSWQLSTAIANRSPVLSDQLAEILPDTRLTLVGTEQPLSLSRTYLLLKTAEILQHWRCRYARLVYGDATVLEAIAPSPPAAPAHAVALVERSLWEVRALAAGLGGVLQVQSSADAHTIQTTLSLPQPPEYPASSLLTDKSIASPNVSPNASPNVPNNPSSHSSNNFLTSSSSNLSVNILTGISTNLSAESTSITLRLQIQCLSPVLQLAFTHLAQAADLSISQAADAPLLTDDLSLLEVEAPPEGKAERPVLWVKSTRLAHRKHHLLSQVRAMLDLSIQPDQLRQAVAAVTQGKTWGEGAIAAMLSERELEILSLLTEGYRDRDIADRLVISESTVKFHLNNAIAKLKARTRYQAIYLAIQQGWI